LLPHGRPDQGSSFTVTNPNGSLPEILNCSISDGSGDKIQRDVINTSGNVQLDRDKFGAFQEFAMS
jgi:hypothetical protein